MMLAQSPLGLHLHWESWTIPAAGLACAGLALMMARIVSGRRKPTPPAPPPPAKETNPQQKRFDPPSHRERRAYVRRGDKPTRVLISDANATAEPFPGLVCNRSMGGLRLTVPRELEENTILSVRAGDAGPDSPWIQVEVKWCHAKGDSWDLGCQFVRTPPYSQLLLFG
jgi:PilZ domain